MNDWPKWKAGNKSDREQMHRWVNEHLDEIEIASANRRGSGYAALKAYIASDTPAIEAAERGDIEPLRQRYPHLTRYLYAPKLGRGEKYMKASTFDPARGAADDVDHIREIWQQHYGRKNRRHDDGPSATEIAARRWDVDEEAVVEALKRRKFSPSK